MINPIESRRNKLRKAEFNQIYGTRKEKIKQDIQKNKQKNSKKS